MEVLLSSLPQGFCCCDKIPDRKQQKVVISADRSQATLQHYMREAGAGTQTSYGRVLLAGLFFMTGSGCLLIHPKSPAQ